MSKHHRPPSTWPPLGAGWEKRPFRRKQETLLTRGDHDPSICESGVSQGNGPNRKELRTGGARTDRGSGRDSGVPGGRGRGQECGEKRDVVGITAGP